MTGDDLQNRWAEVVKACKKSGIHFCFGLNPMLFSPRPLDPTSEEDFEAMRNNYHYREEYF